VQELPAFVIPCALLFYARKDTLGLTPNTILLSLFVLHYSHSLLEDSWDCVGRAPTRER